MQRSFLLFAFGLAACATPKVEGPVGAETVNPDIEERIATEVEEGRARGYPDLAAIRVTPPTLETEKQREEAKTALLAAGEALKAQTAAELEEAKADQIAEQKAEELKAAIARDRVAAANEKPLSKNPPADGQ